MPFSLSLLTYNALSPVEKHWYDNVPKGAPKIRVLPCCEKILKIIKKVDDPDEGKRERTLCGWAAENGHAECLRFAHKRGFKCDDVTLLRAVVRGHADVLEYAHENGLLQPIKNLCDLAANFGQLDVLRLAHRNGYAWSERTYLKAAENGHLHVVKYLHRNGCPWNKWTCEAAALGGHVEILKFAREHRCPWDEATCESAALGGNVDALKWARDNDCPWDGRTFEAARRRNHMHILEYLLADKSWPPQEELY